MAVAYGYAYDTFLSYAHIDDLPVPGASIASGWVSAFHETLENAVQQQLGRRDVALWKDDELRYDQSLSRQLTETVRTSAILVVMLSPGYVSSDWCCRERSAFLKAVRARGDAPVIVVAKEPMPDEALPAELRDRKRFPFYGGRDNITFGNPLPNPHNPTHQIFYDKILELSRVIADVLTKITAIPPPPPRPEPGLPDHPQPPLLRPQLKGKRVFLAETTDDLEEERDGVRAFLDQRGIEVLPAAGVYYPPQAAAFREQAGKDLSAAEVFVQLLSASRGKRPKDVPQGYPNLQWELATDPSAGSIPVLQWCSPSLDISTVKDEHLATLLRAATVRAESLVDFEHAIIAALNKPPQHDRFAAGQQAYIPIFVNVDSDDHTLAQQVTEILTREDPSISVSWPAFSSDTKGNREDLEKNLRECHGLIVIYGRTTNLWVRRQIEEYEKQLAFREQPVLAIDVIAGPPPVPPEPKPPVNKFIRGLKVHDCRIPTDGRIVEEAVLDFLERVRANIKPKAA